MANRFEFRGLSVASAFLMVAVLLTAVPVVSAQDVLPRDNGIYDYHYAPQYRESESHPLRTLAYVLHPVGWVLREGFYRPMSSLISSTEFSRSFFGYRYPYDHRETVCFSPTSLAPDCRNIPPYNSIGRNPVSASVGGAAAYSHSKQVYFPDVAFEFDRADLNALGKGRVRQIASLLSADPGLSVVVEGHTDVRGPDEYNKKLAELRAVSVENELVELGVDPARLQKQGVGEAKPVFADDADWAHAVNRRVKVVVGGGDS